MPRARTEAQGGRTRVRGDHAQSGGGKQGATHARTEREEGGGRLTEGDGDVDDRLLAGDGADGELQTMKTRRC